MRYPQGATWAREVWDMENMSERVKAEGDDKTGGSLSV